MGCVTEHRADRAPRLQLGSGRNSSHGGQPIWSKGASARIQRARIRGDIDVLFRARDFVWPALGGRLLAKAAAGPTHDASDRFVFIPAGSTKTKPLIDRPVKSISRA